MECSFERIFVCIKAKQKNNFVKLLIIFEKIKNTFAKLVIL